MQIRYCVFIMIEAQKQVSVTHVSALSSRMMYKVCLVFCNLWNVVMGAFKP